MEKHEIQKNLGGEVRIPKLLFEVPSLAYIKYIVE